MTSTWLQARIAEKPELADQLNADNVGRKQRLLLNSDTGGRCGVDCDTLKAVEDTGEELMRALQSLWKSPVGAAQP